jgi:hypothetical protein
MINSNMGLIDLSQIEALSPAQGVGAAVGGTMAVIGNIAIPVGLVTGIFAATRDDPGDDRLRNRGFAAAGVGVVLLIAGSALAGISLGSPA